MNHLKQNCFGSSGVRRNEKVKGGRQHGTSAALCCTSAIVLTSVSDARWNQTGSANSPTTLIALAFPSCSAAVLHKARVPGLAQKCSHLCIIIRKPVWPQGCFCTVLWRTTLVTAGISLCSSLCLLLMHTSSPTPPAPRTEQRVKPSH